ncbi:MAG: NAD(P)H-quinone oxidoreductase [Gammaproteobacteria bacterium]|nr:NAD(P)H-quinone oxidoreductase [Gammaproteobacteria bacterium]
MTTQIPEKMTAIAISEPGGAEVLQPIQIPTPKAGPMEILIKVAAAGVNRPDCLQRQGLYPPPPGASEIPGLEVAGTVVALGSEVSRYKVGDKVCALLTGGGYAEYCVTPAVQCLPVPEGMSLSDAASLPETYFTVWANVFQRGQLKEGESLLVHGGASGIGSTAIQLGCAFGAKVYATVGNDEKAVFCKSLGAEKAINYHNEDFVDVIKSDEKGIDVILDIVGAKYLSQNAKVLKPDGRLVIIAVLGGAKAELNLAQVLMKRLTITGSTLRARPPEVKQLIAQELEKFVWPILADGTIKPTIQARFPLTDAAEAHRILDSNAAQGKTILVIAND